MYANLCSLRFPVLGEVSLCIKTLPNRYRNWAKHYYNIVYWVKMLLFLPSAPALPATLSLRTNFFWDMSFCHRCPKSFSPFYSVSPEIILVKFGNRQTDRQILWHHMWVCGFFLSVKFATSLLASLAGGLMEFLCLKHILSWSWLSYNNLGMIIDAKRDKMYRKNASPKCWFTPKHRFSTLKVLNNELLKIW